MDGSLKKARRRLGYHYDTQCRVCKTYVGKIAIANGGGGFSYICSECKKVVRLNDRENLMGEGGRRQWEENERKRWAEDERKRLEEAREVYLKQRPAVFSFAAFKPKLLDFTRTAYPKIYKYLDVEKMCVDVDEIIKVCLGSQFSPEDVAKYITRELYIDGASVIVDYLKVCGYPSDDPFPSDPKYYNQSHDLYARLPLSRDDPHVRFTTPIGVADLLSQIVRPLS